MTSERESNVVCVERLLQITELTPEPDHALDRAQDGSQVIAASSPPPTSLRGSGSWSIDSLALAAESSLGSSDLSASQPNVNAERSLRTRLLTSEASASEATTVDVAHVYRAPHVPYDWPAQGGENERRDTEMNDR